MWMNRNQFNYTKKGTRTIPNDQGLHLELIGSIKYVGFILVKGEKAGEWIGHLCLCTHDEWRNKLPHHLTGNDVARLMCGDQIGEEIDLYLSKGDS